MSENGPAAVVRLATVDSRSIYEVKTMYGAKEMVNTVATKLNSGGSPKIQTSGNNCALIARIAEALTRMAGNEITSSDRDSSEISWL